jgi:quercetin dioxygenase-like cupin family protein
MIQSIERGGPALPLHVVRPHEGTLGSLRILAGADPTRGQYFAFESETAPAPTSDALDVHAHAAYDESEYVLTGTREIVIEDRRWVARSGFFALAPRHARHGMRTVGLAPSRWLHFFSPAGIEQYFREREQMRAACASAEQLRALSRHHGASEMPFSGALEPPVVSPGGARQDGVVASARDTRDAYALVERCGLPEQEHTHPDQEEAFYVICGELHVEVEGVSVTVPTGSFVLVPRGVRRRHSVAPATRLLAICSPGHVVPHAPAGE